MVAELKNILYNNSIEVYASQTILCIIGGELK